jgi:hypothetical protein
MKKVLRFVVASILVASTIVSCKPKEDEPQSSTTSGTIELSGVLTTQTLDASKKYLLKGLVYVNDGVTLTVPAGTVVMGDKASKAALVVNRGGKLIAKGTESKPVVFTSAAPTSYKNYGDWGGIILCGKAINNQSANQVVEGPADFSTVSGNGVYGGTDDADNSGELSYVRIEYAGISYAPDKEVNSLTMASVGSGTTINHVQCSYGGDDSFEWFGGTVNCTYLIAYKGWDDDFDADFGYSGTVQFGVAIRDKNTADISLSNGFEIDNDASGSNLTPKTTAKFSNFTIFGPRMITSSTATISGNYGRAMHLRRNAEATIINSIFAGYTDLGNFDKYQGSVAAKVKNNVLAKHNSAQVNASLFTSGNNCDTTGFYAANTFGPKTGAKTIFADTLAVNTGNVAQATGSIGLTGADFTNTTGFTSTTYRGAMGTTPDAAWGWSAGWLNFSPEATTY